MRRKNLRYSDEVYKLAKHISKYLGTRECSRRGHMLYALWSNLEINGQSYDIKHFAVLKQSWNGLHKGDKVFGKDIQKLDKQGIHYRRIRCFGKETNKALRKLLPVFDFTGTSAQAQHGFHSERGRLSAWGRLTELHELWGDKMSFLSLDLESAFDQITEEQILALLNIVFRLNWRMAKDMAHKMCIKGHCFQGNPLSPAFFNLLSLNISDKIAHTCKGYELVQYADDLMLVRLGNDYIPRREKDRCIAQIEATGWKISKTKVRLYHWNNIQWLGMHTHKGHPTQTGTWRMKKLLGYWHDLISRGVQNTRKLAKDRTHFIHALALEKGLRNCIHTTQHPARYSFSVLNSIPHNMFNVNTQIPLFY